MRRQPGTPGRPGPRFEPCTEISSWTGCCINKKRFRAYLCEEHAGVFRIRTVWLARSTRRCISVWSSVCIINSDAECYYYFLLLRPSGRFLLLFMTRKLWPVLEMSNTKGSNGASRKKRRMQRGDRSVAVYFMFKLSEVEK